jgi:rhodanese-related sulfurtransferase
VSQLPILSEEVFDYLKQKGFEPYASLGELSRGQIADGVRLIVLNAEDVFETKARGLRITLLSGAVRQEPENKILTPTLTHRRMVVTGDKGTRLVAEGDCVVLLADLDFLDTLTSWQEIAENASPELSERMNRVKHSVAFRQLPMDHLEEAIRRMQPKKVKAGETVVKSGEKGDAFYLISSGQAEVWRGTIYDETEQIVATLGPGDTFGDEAMVTGGNRNATVKMASDGEMLVLGEADFRDLMSRQFIDELAPNVVEQMLATGWTPVDVRYDEEYEDSHIPGSIHLPITELRTGHAAKLAKDGKYVTICLSGKRSAVAAFLLKQRGYNAVAMKDGLGSWNGALES